MAPTGRGAKAPEQEPEPESDLNPNVAGDPPTVGQCEWQRGHGPVPIWLVPKDGRWYCADHLRRIIAIAWWKP